MKPPKNPHLTKAGAAILAHLRSSGQQQKADAIALATGLSPAVVRRLLMRLNTAGFVGKTGFNPVYWFAIKEEIDGDA